MTEIQPILVAWLAGFLTGFVVSMPLGPINLTILNEGARRGFKWAVLIGLGAVAMDVIYCTVSYAGFATFFQSRVVKAAMELGSFMLVMYLGRKFLCLHSLPTSKTAERVEEKLHPHSAFTTGFVRVLGNPGVLVLWITVTGAFTAHDWVDANWGSRSASIVGVGMGAAAWFTSFSYLVSLKHQELSPKTLIRLSKASGVFLLGLGVFIGIRIVLLLTEMEHLLHPFQKG